LLVGPESRFLQSNPLLVKRQVTDLPLWQKPLVVVGCGLNVDVFAMFGS